MKASIITPTFNSIEFICHCVDQVARQGKSVLEHIIVDGGSTDGTIERVLELQKQIHNLKLICGPDLGQSDAINKGTLQASGDIIGILNCDDYYFENAVSEAVFILERRLEPTMVSGNCLITESDNQYWCRPSDLKLESLLLGFDLVHYPVNPASYFYHRRVHDIVGGYDVTDHYAMDVDFVLNCASKVNMHYVDSNWGIFNLRPGCKTFEDTHSEARLQKVMSRFQSQLSRTQKISQKIIRSRKILWKWRHSAVLDFRSRHE